MPKQTARRIIDERTNLSTVTNISGVTITSPPSLTDHGLLTGLSDDDHPHYLTSGRGDGRYVPLSRQIAAGNGLTGGGTLASDLTLAVGAGTLLTVGADSVGITAGSTYQFVGTGGGTAASWRDVSELAGAGLTAATGVLAVGAGSGITVISDSVGLTTPGGLSASTINSASGNHTHAIESGLASTLSVSTTNTTGTGSALARADHTHAITTSNNPGAASRILSSTDNGYLQLVRLGLGMSPTRPLDVTGSAAVSGSLTSGSIAVSGAATIGEDLTVGANVLYVNQAGTRVGINRSPDQQFDLDVAGAIRGQYLIGRHAIQLARAIGVWHYDGPAPYNLDYSGSDASHMGVGGIVQGGIIFVPGKFGKAVQLSEATTNLITNPSFELSLAGWTGVSGTLSRVTSAYVYGDYSAYFVGNGSNTSARIQGSISVTGGTTYSLSAYVYSDNNTEQYPFLIVTQVSGTAFQTTTFLTAHKEWQRITTTFAVPADVSSIYIRFYGNGASNKIYLDAVQLESKSYTTPYCDGSLGQGHNWSGTTHASTSSRSVARITYPQPIPKATGTVMLWWRPDAYNSAPNGNYVLWAGQSYLDLSFLGSGVVLIGNQVIALVISPNTWTHIAVTWQDNTANVYRDGELMSIRTISSINLAATLQVGQTTYPANGLVDDLVVLDYAADPKLIRAIYESDAPVFVESSVFHWRSPSRVPIWVDEYGLWARGVGGNEILGLYGGDPRDPTGNILRSWGGLSLAENDVVIGRDSQAAVYWDDSVGSVMVGRSSANNMLLSSGTLQLRDSTTVYGQLSGSKLTLGLTTGEHVNLSSTALEFKNGSNVHASLVDGQLTLGNTADLNYIRIDGNNGIQLYTLGIRRGHWLETGGLVIGETANNRTRLEINAVGTLSIINRSGSGVDNTAIQLSGSGDATFAGTITSTNGLIGGWGILTDAIYSSNIAMYSGVTGTARLQVGNTGYIAGISSAGATGDVTLWAGNSHNNRASAPFRVTAGGELTATAATITGSITASSGSITGALSLGSSGGIYQGSGTFASPITGLRLWNDNGVGRIGGYNAGLLQWYAGTDGVLYAGAGNVVLDDDGISVIGSRLAIKQSSATAKGIIYSNNPLDSSITNASGVGVKTVGNAAIEAVQLRSNVVGSNYFAELVVESATTSGKLHAFVGYQATSSEMFLNTNEYSLKIGGTTTDFAIASNGDVTVLGRLSVGSDNAGLAGYTTFTNGNNVAANSTGTGTIKFKGTTSRDSTGFVKIYIGTTAYWVPVFNAITG